MRILRSTCLVGFLALSAWTAWAQAPSPAKPRSSGCPPPVKFHSVSIRARDTVYAHVDGYTNEGFSMRGVTLAAVIQYVFSPQKIEDLPDWAKKERYDVIAEIDPDDCCRWSNETPEEESLTVQDFLREKLKLKWHRETRMVGGFELVVGKKGSKLVPGKPEEALRTGANQPMGNPFGTLTGNPDGPVKARVSMEELAKYLSTEEKHPVIDKTGLPGRYDLSGWYLHAGQSYGAYSGSDRLIEADGTPVQPQSPRSSTVFEDVEQLGLELKGTKVPLDVLVIDQMERPVE